MKSQPDENFFPTAPYIFRHRHGTLTVYAVDKDEAELRAKKIARGMPLKEEHAET